MGLSSGLDIEIELVGFLELDRKLEGISHRMLNLEPVWPEVERVLNEGEERIFRRLKGRFVDTGALKDSLTNDHATDAIRERHRFEFRFGTSLYYARFQRKPGTNKSAVLMFQPRSRRLSIQAVRHYITGVR